jgi:hypothetical protein
LATGTAHSVAATLAIRLRLILGTIWAGAVAHLLRITGADARSADCAGGGELAVLTAVLIRVVADSVGLKLASVGIATRVVTTSCFATTVTLLIAFYDAVTTGLAGGKCNFLIVSKTIRLDAIAPQG